MKEKLVIIYIIYRLLSGHTTLNIMLSSLARRAIRPHRVARAMSGTTFDGDMARLYLKFFNEAEEAWLLTRDVYQDAAAATGVSEPAKILDVASGPGEPALTLARTFPGARVLSTDGADAMVGLANQRIADSGLSNIQTARMDLNDFSPVPSEFKPADLVTAQFALMFTEDLPGALGQIHDVLRDGGLLVGTCWEEFHILPLMRETMTRILGQAPPPPPINPLSMKDKEMVDASLAEAGFTTMGRHNETALIDINLGKFDDADTIKTCLIPVMPTLAQLQEGGEHGDDVFGDAAQYMRDAIANQGMVDANGDVVVKTSTFRYFVARK